MNPLGADMFDGVKLAFAGLAGGVLMALAPRGTGPRVREPAVIALAACAVIAAASAVASPVPLEAVFGSYERRLGALALVVAVAAFYGVSAARKVSPLASAAAKGRSRTRGSRDAEAPRVAVREALLASPLDTAVALGAGIVGVVAVLQRLGGVPGSGSFEGRAFATFGNPVFLGAFLALSIPAVMRMADRVGRLRFVLIAPVLTGIVASGSRAAAAAALAAVAVGAVASRTSRGTARESGTVWFAIALAFATVFALAYAARVAQTPSEAAARSPLLRIGLQGVAERPVLGHGWGRYEAYFRQRAASGWSFVPGSSEVPDTSHSFLVDLAFSSGVPAALAFLAFLVAVGLSRSNAGEAHDAVPLAFLAAALVLAASAPFNGPLLVWLAMAAAVARPVVSEVPEVGSTLPVSRRERRRAAALHAARVVAGGTLALAALAWSYYVLPADAHAKRAAEYESAVNLSEAQDAAVAAAERAPFEKAYLNRAAGAAIAGDAASTATVELALDYADRALALDPYFYEAHFVRGLALVALGDLGSPERYEEAAAEFRVCAFLTPRDPQAHYYLGLAQAVAGDEKAAERAWKRAVAIWPRYADAHFALGYLYEKQGRKRNAAASYRRALAVARPEERQAIEEALARVEK